MNIAAIDIGTNTLRLLIGRVNNGRLTRVASDRAVTRLGKDLMKTGVLSADSINKSLSALSSFKDTCDKYNVKKLFAVGTSALREAKNSNDFISAVKISTGIEIEIISGEREAELTINGVTAGFEDKKIPGAFFIADIGGGSTEWIFNKGSNQLSAVSGQEQTENTKSNSSLITHASAPTVGNSSLLLMGSLPVGAVKLFETFIKHDPPSFEELQSMTDDIKNVFSSSLPHDALRPTLDAGFPLSLIATGGTPTTVAAIDLSLDKYDGDRIHMHNISATVLATIFNRLVSLPQEERSKVKGMGPERSDIIIPGALVLMALMEYLKAGETIISDYGLLEGLLCYNLTNEKGF